MVLSLVPRRRLSVGVRRVARLITSPRGGQIAMVRPVKVRRCEEQEISLALQRAGITTSRS